MSEKMDPERTEGDAEEETVEEEVGEEGGEAEGGEEEVEGAPGDGQGAVSTLEAEVEDYNKLPQPPQDDRLILRRFLLEVFSGLYTLLLISLGIVLPVAIYLSGGNFKQDGIHLAVILLFPYYTEFAAVNAENIDAALEKGERLSTVTVPTYLLILHEIQIFYYYIYIVGTAFFVYLTILVRRTKATVTKNAQIGDVTDAESDVGGTKGTYVINENVHAVRRERHESDDVRREGTQQNGPDVPPVYECPDGVNFFLRMGLIVFGLVAVLLEGMRLVDIGRFDTLWQCYGPWHFAAVVFKLLFILVQTFTLFKCHSVGINVHKPLVKLGLLHAVATNLCLWATIIVTEAFEAYVKNTELQRGVLADVTFNVNATVNATVNVTVNATEDDLVSGSCISFPDTLSTAASPYLFPFIIEYALLAAAILYKMHALVGPQKYHELRQKVPLRLRDKEHFPDLYAKQPAASDCSKANSGLFIGMGIFTAVATSVCFYLYFSSMEEDQGTVMGYIYVISDLTVKSLIFVSLVPAYWKILQLYFRGVSDSVLEQDLLVFALFWTYVLDGFVVVASVKTIGSDNELVSKASGMLVAASVMDFLQVTLMAAFIVDGLHRRSVTVQTTRDKPGRSIVTFLLLLNLALWLINTFEMKMVHRYSIFSFYYGHLGWTIILSVTAPIAIYFRFQCAVCLSVIWTRAYTKEPAERLSDSQLEKCGKIL